MEVYRVLTRVRWRQYPRLLLKLMIILGFLRFCVAGLLLCLVLVNCISWFIKIEMFLLVWYFWIIRLVKFDKKNWRTSYQALIVIEYLMTHGPESVAKEFQADKDVIRDMGCFQLIDEKGYLFVTWVFVLGICLVLWLILTPNLSYLWYADLIGALMLDWNLKRYWCS